MRDSAATAMRRTARRYPRCPSSLFVSLTFMALHSSLAEVDGRKIHGQSKFFNSSELSLPGGPVAAGQLFHRASRVGRSTPLRSHAIHGEAGWHWSRRLRIYLSVFSHSCLVRSLRIGRGLRRHSRVIGRAWGNFRYSEGYFCSVTARTTTDWLSMQPETLHACGIRRAGAEQNARQNV